jgi:hypothetical protein
MRFKSGRIERFIEGLLVLSGQLVALSALTSLAFYLTRFVTDIPGLWLLAAFLVFVGLAALFWAAPVVQVSAIIGFPIITILLGPTVTDTVELWLLAAFLVFVGLAALFWAAPVVRLVRNVLVPKATPSYQKATATPPQPEQRTGEPPLEPDVHSASRPQAAATLRE